MHQHFLRSEIKEKIAQYNDKTDQICISYTGHEHEIVWKEEGKEFFYNNKLYDVIKSETKQGKVFLYCVNDEKEHKLISQNNETVKTNNTPGKKSGIAKIELPVLFFAEQDRILTILPGAEQISVVYQSALHTGMEESESPPPKTNPV